MERVLSERLPAHQECAKLGFRKRENCYLEGRGVKKNVNTALYWYEQAAKNGCAEAQFNLGNCYFSGIGVIQNYEEAFKFYKAAADHGSAQAYYNLGSCYLEGKGVEKNELEALVCYEKAAACGDASLREKVNIMKELLKSKVEQN